MLNWKKAKFIALATVFFALLFLVSPAKSAFNPQINYQGKLMNAVGQPAPNGDYNFKFQLCSAPDNCTSPVWTETYESSNKITVTSSLFSVLLGSLEDFDGVDFNQTLYLEVQVGGTSTPSYETLLPRKKLGAVPVSFYASTSTYSNNSGQLQGQTWASPGAIGTDTATTAVFTNATTTNILRVIGNSYFGTVASGTWQGTVVANTYGGTGQNSSGWTGFAYVTSGIWSPTTSISLFTNDAGYLTSYTETDPVWTTASGSLTVAHFATNTVSQWYNDAGYITSSATTSPAGNDGEIQFNDSGAFGATTTFVWDNSAGRLGINTTTPAGKIHVVTGASAEITIGTPSNVQVTPNYASKKYYTANSYSHNMRVYAFKDTSAGRVYSSSYDDLASDWTDNGSAGKYDLSWTWDAVSGASGYRILKYDTSHPYNYDVYKDVATNSYTDDNGDAWLSSPVMTPTSLYESGKALRLGYDSANYVDFNINSDASFGMFNNAGTGILYMDEDGKIAVDSTDPLAQFYVGGTGDIIAEGIFDNEDSLGVSGAGTRMMWYPEKAAFRAGRVTGDDWDDANIGDYSAVFGMENLALGEASFIAGSSNEDAGAGNAVFGTMNTANGYYSIVAGLEIV